MLARLGQLNSQLLVSHYAPTPSTHHQVGTLVRHADALHSAAATTVRDARSRGRVEREHAAESERAALARHIATHTLDSNALCAHGTCLHAPVHVVDQLVGAARGLHGSGRVGAIRRLTRVIPRVRALLGTDPTTPRICTATGIPCVVLDMLDGPEDSSSPDERERAALDVLSETKLTRRYAHLVARSASLEHNAGRGVRAPGDVRGGRVAVSKFFAAHGLPAHRGGESIREAIEGALDDVAPRARERIRLDMWSRWVGV